MTDNNKRPNQCDRVLQYLRDFGEITQFEALRDIAVQRLSARISEMKKRGIKFEVKSRVVKNRYEQPCIIAVYSLAAQ